MEKDLGGAVGIAGDRLKVRSRELKIAISYRLQKEIKMGDLD